MKKRRTIWDISDDDFRRIIEESNFYSDVLRQCGCKNYGSIKNRIEKQNLDISHFLRFRSMPNKSKIPLHKITVINSNYSTYDLKRRLIEELGWEYNCAFCDIGGIYNGKPLKLQLDHINGVNNDHRLDNLRLLCPNCHSQTSTFSGRNCKPVPKTKCADCEEPISNGAIRCVYCENVRRATKSKMRKVLNRPSLKQLEQDLEELPYTKVGEKYCVSDNCIRKWIRNYKNSNKPK